MLKQLSVLAVSVHYRNSGQNACDRNEECRDVAACWCLIMSEWFFQALQQDYFEASQSDRTHWPAGECLLKQRKPYPYLFLYTRQNRPVNTEEYTRYSTPKPLKLRDFASLSTPLVNTTRSRNIEIAIDEFGFVHTGGFTGRRYFNDPDDIGNALGLGPGWEEGPPSAAYYRTTKVSEELRKPNNPLAQFKSTRFVKCAIVGYDRSLPAFAFRPLASYLLSEDGSIWVAGYPTYNSSDEPSAFPSHPSGSLPYFTPRADVAYYPPSGGSVLEHNQRFKDIAIVRERIFLITTDGRLLERGEFDYPWLTNKWIEQSGFVDSVQVVSGGSGYGSSVNLTVAPPSHPNGVSASVTPVITAGTITGVRVLDGGWGYTSAPAITITGRDIAGATPAVLQTHLFSGSWKSVFAAPDALYGHAAITEEGALYRWGTASGNYSVSPRREPNAFSGGYVDVAMNGGPRDVCMVAVRTDGSVDYSRLNPVTGAETGLNLATAQIDGHQIVGCASDSRDFFLLTSEGIALRYGVGRPIAPLPTAARFAKLFSAEVGVRANRNEEFDEHGNRVSPLPILLDRFG